MEHITYIGEVVEKLADHSSYLTKPMQKDMMPSTLISPR